MVTTKKQAERRTSKATLLRILALSQIVRLTVAMTASAAPNRSAASPFPVRAREASPLRGQQPRAVDRDNFLTGEGSFNAVGRQQGGGQCDSGEKSATKRMKWTKKKNKKKTT